MTTFGTTEVGLPMPPVSTQFVSFSQPVESDTSFLSIVEEATSLVVIPEGVEVAGHPPLATLLLAQLKVSRRGVLAITYLDAEEYGSGQTEREAVLDLVSSLAEYKDSLEKREHRLSEGALADLAKLRRLFEPPSK